MAIAFSVPQYIPDSVSGETVTGYQVQSLAPVAGLPQTYGAWQDVNLAAPYASNLNIFDPAGTALHSYRVKPVRQVTYKGTVYTIDTPWSRPFQYDTPLYDPVFTRVLLPALRFTYLKDEGTIQTNGSVLQETQGAGDGVWDFDGVKTRFPLQYVMNDDPVLVLDNLYSMNYTSKGSGSPVQMLPDVDYSVHARSGTVEFAKSPAIGDYARFEFRTADFVNDDLLQALSSGVNALSTFGKNGYCTTKTQNLVQLNRPLESPDLGELFCQISIYLMRHGLSEQALRNATTWRDGGESSSPFGSRGLDAIVQKLSVTEEMVHRAVNTYLRATVAPQGYGEFETFWNMTDYTPLVSGMFKSLFPGFGMGVAGMGIPYYGWWL